MVDTVFSAGSPWHHDLLLPKFSNSDFLGELGFDTDISLGGSEDVETSMHNGFDDWDEVPSSSISCSTSVAESECSEELCVDVEDQSLMQLPSRHSEYLTAVDLLNVFEDGCLTETTVCPQDVTSVLSTVCTTSYSSVSNPKCESVVTERSSRSLERVVRKRSLSECLSEAGSWAKLDNGEKLALVECLTDVITQEMGLREQLDVIRIISPQARVSPTDREFVIDLEYLNDDKLRQVHEYIVKHMQHKHNHNNNNTNTNTNANANNNASNKFVGTKSARRARSASAPRETSTEAIGSEFSSTPTPTRKNKRQRKRQTQEERQRQRKEYRQVLKERRSGLFAKEEVLSLTNDDPDDDDDEDLVDILS